jgi:hypothetical protein
VAGFSRRARINADTRFSSSGHSGRRKEYAELTKNDELIHHKVVVAINGLRDFLSVERKRIPATILYDVDRLESLLFSGYDPYFEGDEPSGL